MTDENDASATEPVFSPVATHIFWSAFHVTDLAAVSKPLVLMLVAAIPCHPAAPAGSVVRIRVLVLPLLVAGVPAAIQTLPLYASEYTCERMAPVPMRGVQFCPETSEEINRLTSEASTPLLAPPTSQRPAADALASNWFQAHVFKLRDASVEETTALVQAIPFEL